MGFQVVDEGLAQRPANGTAILSIAAVDAALDLEEGIDASYDLQRQRRDRYRCLA